MAAKKSGSNFCTVTLPLVYAIYPIAYLYSIYVVDISFIATLRSIAVSMLATFSLSCTVRWMTGDWKKTALITTLIVILHSTYGHVFNCLTEYFFGSLFLGQHKILLPLWVLTGLLGSFAIAKHKHIPSNVIKVLAGVGIGLVLMAAFQTGYRAIQLTRSLASVSLAPTPLLSDETFTDFRTQNTPLPDVYYIVLDSYVREDAMLQDFQFDNHEFIEYLRRKGFIVPDCTQSNYANTVMSLSTTLHMNYMDAFNTTIQRGDRFRNFVLFKEFLQHNPVRDNFINLGYRMIAFETDYWWADILDADLFMVSNGNILNQFRSAIPLNAFEEKLLTTTSLVSLVNIYVDRSEENGFEILSDRERHQHMVVKELDQLQGIISGNGPKFVFAHIVAPHVPYVYSPDGAYLFHTDEKQGYRDAVQFINARMQAIIDKILEVSSVPPIIIIQGDHGVLPDTRLKVLNAYYLPGGNARVYPAITPVNTFRVIFDQYYNGSYGLLPDISRYSNNETPFLFTKIAESCVNSW